MEIRTILQVMKLMYNSKLNHLNVLIRSVEDLEINHNIPVLLSCFLFSKKKILSYAARFFSPQFFPPERIDGITDSNRCHTCVQLVLYIEHAYCYCFLQTPIILTLCEVIFYYTL